ncbi:ribonuclease R [Weissella diestrammenae]|uniref:Ribonuclease R n=1 Tax=Weissella diestrammenae TaxID=1162633 RepID=A0A7G9T400_9LACO|nr:ribonuclease R [Weissella diestrammenae]MCM0583021.1 ribonuclease R [Weissella diestrammenae]QNN74825.1 ribonuclease R [Weissella diestrammenae]
MNAIQLQNQLFGFLKANNTQTYSAQTLTDGLHLDDANGFTQVVQALAVLEREGKIIEQAGAFQYNASVQGYIGTFRSNAKGFGFVSAEGLDEDVFVNPDNTALALDLDQVRVSLLTKGDTSTGKGPEGKVEEIITHDLNQVVGEFKLGSDYTGYIGTINMTDKKHANYAFLVAEGGVQANDGEVVVATIQAYPTPAMPKQMTGIITETIGFKDEPGVDIMAIVHRHKVPAVFPEAVLAQAEKIPDTVQASEKVGREDITDQPLVTIDSIESKDLDDAVVVWKLPNGNFHLGVHIADVSHYVVAGTPLDEEAYNRGTSVYLTDRVIPMLPRNISNGIASLNPGVERLAMSAEMEFTPSGDLVKHRLHESVMKSHARMTYKAVNAILAGDEETRAEYSELVPMFEEMSALHDALAKKRTARGAIEFDAPEAKIIVDEQGKPVDIQLRERGLSERMIESFMLAANETVAMHFDQLNVPFLYRVHTTPNIDKSVKFFEFVKALGGKVNADPNDVKPMDFQKIHDEFMDQPSEQMVSTMMLRSMQRAEYSNESLGHFGLGAKYYTHFTSPIRRYPDLTVHRLIKWYAKHGIDETAQSQYRDQLAEIGKDTSVRERRAIDTERDTDAMKKTEFMADKVGEEFDAVVNGVMKFGMFVSLPNTVEGLIHTSNLTDDYYAYDESHLALIGRRFHHIYQIGQAVKVKLIRVDKEQSALDFVLVDPTAAPITDIKVADDRRGSFGGGNRQDRRTNDKRNRSDKGNKTHNDGKPFGAPSDRRKPESKHSSVNRKGRH